jgi:hypothetical protein
MEPTKPIKTAKELQEMLIQEIQNHPDLRRIRDVAITPQFRTASYLPNWSPTFITDGVALVRPRAVTELQNKYDLAEGYTPRFLRARRRERR